MEFFFRMCSFKRVRRDSLVVYNARLTDRRSHQNPIIDLVVFFFWYIALFECGSSCGLFDFPIKSQTEKTKGKKGDITSRHETANTVHGLVIHENRPIIRARLNINYRLEK
jgi:hypothetical protein